MKAGLAAKQVDPPIRLILRLGPFIRVSQADQTQSARRHRLQSDNRRRSLANSALPIGCSRSRKRYRHLPDALFVIVGHKKSDIPLPPFALAFGSRHRG